MSCMTCIGIPVIILRAAFGILEVGFTALFALALNRSNFECLHLGRALVLAGSYFFMMCLLVCGFFVDAWAENQVDQDVDAEKGASGAIAVSSSDGHSLQRRF